MRRFLLLTLALLAISAFAEAQPLLLSTVTFQSGATTTGGGTTMDTQQISTVAVQIIPGTNDTYRLVFEASQGGDLTSNANWALVSCYPQGSSTAATSVTTTISGTSLGLASDNQGHFRCNVAGYLRFRVRITSITAKGGLTVRGTGFQYPWGLGTINP